MEIIPPQNYKIHGGHPNIHNPPGCDILSSSRILDLRSRRAVKIGDSNIQSLEHYSGLNMPVIGYQ